MGNIGEDPSEYLPQDTRQQQHQQPHSTKYPPNNNLNELSYSESPNVTGNQQTFDQYGGADHTDSMNGPTSLAMYGSQSPNPPMGHHHVSNRRGFPRRIGCLRTRINHP